MFSADSHVCEPPDLWTRRLPPSLRARAPHIVRNLDGRPGDFFVCEDTPARSIFAAFAAGAASSELKERSIRGFDLAPPSVWDPAARLLEQDRDQVAAEVLYPTLTDLVFGAKDKRYRQACVAAYNDFLSEYCEHDPARLVGLGVVDLEDVPWAVEEVKRIRRLGFRGVVIRADPPVGQGYERPELDAFWAAVVDAGFSLAMHRGALRRDISVEAAMPLRDYTLIPFQAQHALATLLFSGLWEQFPSLRLVLAEFDVGWLMHFLRRADHAAIRFGSGFHLRLSRLPSEQVARSIAFTFGDETEELDQLVKLLGAQALLWASDYPHADSTWPRSQDVAALVRAKVSADDAEQMLIGNWRSLYSTSV